MTLELKGKMLQQTVAQISSCTLLIPQSPLPETANRSSETRLQCWLVGLVLDSAGASWQNTAKQLHAGALRREAADTKTLPLCSPGFHPVLTSISF